MIIDHIENKIKNGTKVWKLKIKDISRCNHCTCASINVYGFFLLAYNEISSGEILDSSFKIFYFHMPIAITAYFSFFIVFAASIMQLRSHDVKWDIYARSAAEIGVIFAMWY